MSSLHLLTNNMSKTIVAKEKLICDHGKYGMIFCRTMTLKIKTNQTIQKWFVEQSKQAAILYNLYLDVQFELENLGKKLLTAFDLATHFRTFSLGSDDKDRIFERVADSTKNRFPVNPCAMKSIGKALKKKR